MHVITFAEQEIDRDCHAGEEGWGASDARPVRDAGQPTGGFTLSQMPVRRRQYPWVISTAERAAVAASLGCPPWEVGPCSERDGLMRRYGRDAAMTCAPCRAALSHRAREIAGRGN